MLAEVFPKGIEFKQKKIAVFSDAELNRFLNKEDAHGSSDLSELVGRPLKSFSSGEKRKILLDYLLYKNPDILLLDNPFDCLDKTSVAALKLKFQKLSEKIQIIQVFKRAADLLPFIDEILRVNNGKLLENLSLAAFRKGLQKTPKSAISLSIPPPLHKLSHIPESLVTFRNVSVTYNEKPVLHNISWEVKKGQFWQLAGPNGSGKTTLLSMVYGDNPKAFGVDLFLFGQKKGSGESVWEIKKKIGYLSPSLSAHFKGNTTAQEMITAGLLDSIGLYEQPSKKQLQTAGKWLKTIQLYTEKDRLFKELPLLQQRLVLIARAMIKHPPLLILDEPATGLDDKNAKVLTSLINSISQESDTAIIYVSHREEPGLQPQFVFTLKPLEKGSIGIVTS